MNREKLFRWAWTFAPKVPQSILMGLAHIAADAVSFVNPGSVRQLRRNYQHLLNRKVTSAEVRAGVRSYFRCYAQQFSLPGWSTDYLVKMLEYPKAQELRALMNDGPVILALTHSANWDIAGAWYAQGYAPIITVAEKLEPESLFKDFVEFRESLGMEILGAAPGEHIFDTLVDLTRGRTALVPLLADRDITGRGIEVQLGAARALVAAGPAALALRLDRPLIAGHMTYKKENGAWRVHAHFTDPIEPPEPRVGETRVEAYTREWVKAIEPAMMEGFIDWHMMQKLFIADLDPERLRRARERAQ